MAPIPLICLHGWGASKASFTELTKALEKTNIDVLAPDLPGFGNEPEPTHPFTVNDYAEWVIEWVKQHVKSKEWFLLGHSHGGRVAIKLVTEKLPAEGVTLPSHLFLCAAAGIRHPRHVKRIIGLTLAKGGKLLFSLPGLRTLAPLSKKLLYKLVRVHDYEKASEIMRKTLIAVTQENLRAQLKDINVPTDIFWGTDDGMTPYSDALLMEQEIPHAVLHTYKGVRHRVHRDRANEIANVIQQYL